jgi:trk system potassium uptake protein TrkA
MKIIIMGCGRVGAQLAIMLEKEGHEVTTIDKHADSFKRLPSDFGGKALLGNGTDEDDLKKAGIEETDAFVAVTEGDNRNVMAAQIAKNIYNVPKVVCRIYDPLRRDIYSMLGLDAISPTTVFAQLLKEKLES